MSTLHLRLLHHIPTLKGLNCSSSCTARFLSTQKHFASTTFASSSNLSSPSHSTLRPHCHFPHQHLSCSITTNAKDDDSDDSDFSDFSDFSDSDDSDADDLDVLSPSKTSKGGQTTTTKRPSLSTMDEIEEGQLMKDRLIISNLNFSTNRNDLWELCEHYGTVTDVHLPANRNRDFHNRGFGFVTFENEKDAQNALDNVAGTMFNSRQLRAGFARAESAERQRFSNDPALDRMPASTRNDFQFTEPMERIPSDSVEGTTRSLSSSLGLSSDSSMSSSPSTTSKTTPQVSSDSVLDGMLTETAITVSGLPGSVSLNQINKMFGDFGIIKNITFSPYQMMGVSMMNAIVTVALKEDGNGTSLQSNKRKIVEPEQEKESISGFSFQEKEVKDRSVDKEEIKTMRRGGMGGGGGGNRGNMTGNEQQRGRGEQRVGGIDPDVLAKEIDELLADTDSEEEGGKDSSDDSDSDIDLDTTESDSDSDNESDDERK